VDDLSATISVNPMAKPMIQTFLLLSVIMSVLSGCASSGYSVTSNKLVAGNELQDRCSAQWQQFRSKVNAAEVYDAQDWPLPDYPYLRVNRAASYVLQQELRPDQKVLWLKQAYERGKNARQLENQKLAKPVDLSRLENCLVGQLSVLAEDPKFWVYAGTHSYPDKYLTGRQIAGLYYFFRPIVGWRVDALKEEVTDVFQRYENQYDWRYYVLQGYGRQHPGQVVKVGRHEIGRQNENNQKEIQLQNSSPPLEWDEINTILNPATHKDELGLPVFNRQEAQQLLNYYHPVIALETGHRDDRIGRPARNADRWTTSSAPEVFTLLTTTFWQGQWVPQLVYHWWYPSRPQVGWLDILAGELDGLIWRVTLNWDGKVLFYDSIHPCGCYHKVFPALPAIKFSGTSADEEALMVLPVEHPGAGQQPVIQISSVAHYVVGLSFRPSDQRVATEVDDAYPSEYVYKLTDYNELRTLKAGKQYLFGADGLVAGSERLERFLLWNMGVDSPGAMRQWGQHATAFASRRHFDDPQFFNRYFYVQSEAGD
jgi:hypothetical protein